MRDGRAVSFPAEGEGEAPAEGDAGSEGDGPGEDWFDSFTSAEGDGKALGEAAATSCIDHVRESLAPLKLPGMSVELNSICTCFCGVAEVSTMLTDLSSASESSLKRETFSSPVMCTDCSASCTGTAAGPER